MLEIDSIKPLTVMEAEEITVRVTPEAARIYRSASEDERRKLDLLVSLRLTETISPRRSLEEVIRDISQEAQARGLTPEILKEILDET